MPRSRSVSIHRAAIAAACGWTAAGIVFLIATVSAAWHDRITATDVALFGWGVMLVGAACVISVKYLLDKYMHDTLDEVALLHQARDEAWRKRLEARDVPASPAAPMRPLPKQMQS